MSDGRVLIRVPVRMPPELHAELRALSYLLNVSLNEILNYAARRWVRDVYRENPKIKDQVDEVLQRE